MNLKEEAENMHTEPLDINQVAMIDNCSSFSDVISDIEKELSKLLRSLVEDFRYPNLHKLTFCNMMLALTA
jgi:hypothetical protein